MNETERQFLRRLRDSQPGGLPLSATPKRCDALVESLRICGAVEVRPATSGRGRVLRITSQAAFERFVAGRLPQGVDVDTLAISDRAAAVALLADAKAVSEGVAQGLFVRSTNPDTTIQSADGTTTVSVGRLTGEVGGAALPLSNERTWRFDGTVAVIENADTFWQHERVLPDVDIAVLGGGNISGRLLQWLASPEMAACLFIHWADYDPVGVCQYLRFADACPGRVETFTPAEVDELLPRFGKRKLVTEQPQYLNRLRQRVSDSHVRRMVGLFDSYRKGLEQEILLHPFCTGADQKERPAATNSSRTVAHPE